MTDSVENARGGHAVWTTVFAVLGAGIVAAAQVGKVPIAIPMLRDALGLSLAQAGALMSVVAVLALAASVPASALVPVLGDRRMLLAGLLAVIGGAAAGALAPSLAVLMTARVAEGLGFLLVTVSAPAALQRVAAPARRDVVFALWSCYMPAGMALAMAAGPLFSGWRALWWASAALALAAGAAVWIAVPRRPPPPLPRTAGALLRGMAADVSAVVRSGPALRSAACFTLYSLMSFALYSFLPILLIERMGVAHGAVGLLSAATVLANVAGNLAAGHLLARGAGRATLIAGACSVMGAAALGIFLSPFGNVATYALCLIFSGVGGLVPATLIASAPAVAPRVALAPIVIGLLMQGSGLGQVVGPMTVGAAIDAYGWPAAALLVGAAAAAAVWVARGMRLPARVSACRP